MLVDIISNIKYYDDNRININSRECFILIPIMKIVGGDRPSSQTTSMKNTPIIIIYPKKYNEMYI